jgi:16S rRNA (cytidine1402-2'-O)-methyltransferase
MIYFVPTPIGNLEDITVRSLRVLKSCPYLIVENFSSTKLLLKNLGIETKSTTISFVKNEQFNLTQIETTIQKAQQEGVDIGVMSEAGTPSISDPGYLLTSYLIANQIPYTVLPGASSVIVAACASGMVTKGFEFWGFIPTKKGRQTFLTTLKTKLVQKDHNPIIIFESVHRIDTLLNELKASFDPSTKVFISREQTKLFEQYLHFTVEQLINGDSCCEFVHKGEFVVVLD